VKKFSSEETTTLAETEETASIDVCNVCLLAPKDNHITSGPGFDFAHTN